MRYLRQAGLLLSLLLCLGASTARADDYTDTIDMFRKAGASGAFFAKSYGYAVFPNVGKGGFMVGGGYGSGRVYAQGNYIGDTSMTQLSVGWQVGGQAYSQIIFFEDDRSLAEFTSGNFEFGAGVGAVAITSGASANAGTSGSSLGASGGKNDAANIGSYYKGMAVFTIAKGGLMAEATVTGQKFSYRKL